MVHALAVMMAAREARETSALDKDRPATVLLSSLTATPSRKQPTRLTSVGMTTITTWSCPGAASESREVAPGHESRAGFVSAFAKVLARHSVNRLPV